MAGGTTGKQLLNIPSKRLPPVLVWSPPHQRRLSRLSRSAPTISFGLLHIQNLDNHRCRCSPLPVLLAQAYHLLWNSSSIISHGQSEVVKFLLSKGFDVDAVSDLGTPLVLAALRGHASTLKILLQHNADPNKGAGLFGILDTALHESSVSCVKLLIQGGANVSGDYPLAKAAEKGLTEAIKCLLEAGANPHVVDRFGRLPIELAVEYGTREDVEILFPFTSPISTVANWSVDGIISHVKMEIKQFEALKMDNFDAKLLSNRSLCWLRMGDGHRAYEDAAECKKLCPKWAKVYYRQGAAQIFMEDYDGAYHSLSRALELDLESQEIAKLLLETIEVELV